MSVSQSWRRALLVAVTAVVTAGVLASPAGAVGPETRAPSAGAVETAVGQAVLTRAGMSAAQATAAGRTARSSVLRTDPAGWAFGTAILTAPARPDAYPLGWVFLAEHTATGWRVGLDHTADFTDLAARAPAGVLSTTERTNILGDIGIEAVSSNNTGLRLPYAVGQSWTLSGGPHGWGGSETPYSSIDLSGGDANVRAAGGGSIYVMCTSTQSGQFGGWLRIYHSNGYTTDYYHLWNPITPAGGSSIGEGTFIGNTGTNLCAGGSASGRHVHFAILDGATRVSWNWRSIGKWVLWQGSSAYGGYALHGSTQVNVGGLLYNYGVLGSNQGIVDAWGSGSVNKRSGPGTGYSIVGSVADGTTITISCWRNGTTHTGRYGTTSVWDKLTDGTWVSDAFVYTGVNTIGPSC